MKNYRLCTMKLFRQFSAKQALKVTKIWKAPPVVLEYLRDEARGKDRSDIRSAAWSAAVESAAESAAWAAAESAAESAAWAAAESTALYATWPAARSAAKQQFNQMCYKALGLK